MPRVCSVCTHPDRPAIDQALAGGKPLRETSALFRVSEDALWRHREDHLPATLAKAAEAAEAARADDLLAEVRDLKARALGILDTAEAAGDLRAAVAAIREARGCIELLAELAHELDRRPVLNVLLLPEWLQVRSALLEALQPYPEARTAVVARLETLNGHRS